MKTIEKVQVWVYRTGAQGQREVLLLRLKEERGGFWQPVTGGVDEGEALLQAALREASEETGFEFPGRPFAVGHEFSFDGKRGQVEVRAREVVFGLEASGGKASDQVKLDPHEHVDWKWCAVDEALGLVHYSSNRDGLQALLRILRKNP